MPIFRCQNMTFSNIVIVLISKTKECFLKNLFNTFDSISCTAKVVILKLDVSCDSFTFVNAQKLIE